jgi:hypothetical protein
VYRASLGCGQTCYQAALTALGQSFITADLSAANLQTGPQYTFSTPPATSRTALGEPAHRPVRQPVAVTDAGVPQTTPA